VICSTLNWCRRGRAISSTDQGGGKRRGGHSRTKGPKTKNRASDDDCTNEGPNKYFEPSAAFNQVAKKVASNAAEHSADYSRDLKLCSILVRHRGAKRPLEKVC
jgi:hypothetical protein